MSSALTKQLNACLALPLRRNWARSPHRFLAAPAYHSPQAIMDVIVQVRDMHGILSGYFASIQTATGYTAPVPSGV